MFTSITQDFLSSTTFHTIILPILLLTLILTILYWKQRTTTFHSRKLSTSSTIQLNSFISDGEHPKILIEEDHDQPPRDDDSSDDYFTKMHTSASYSPTTTTTTTNLKDNEHPHIMVDQDNNHHTPLSSFHSSFKLLKHFKENARITQLLANKYDEFLQLIQHLDEKYRIEQQQPHDDDHSTTCMCEVNSLETTSEGTFSLESSSAEPMISLFQTQHLSEPLFQTQHLSEIINLQSWIRGTYTRKFGTLSYMCHIFIPALIAQHVRRKYFHDLNSVVLRVNIIQACVKGYLTRRERVHLFHGCRKMKLLEKAMTLVKESTIFLNDGKNNLNNIIHQNMEIHDNNIENMNNIENNNIENGSIEINDDNIENDNIENEKIENIPSEMEIYINTSQESMDVSEMKQEIQKDIHDITIHDTTTTTTSHSTLETHLDLELLSSSSIIQALYRGHCTRHEYSQHVQLIQHVQSCLESLYHQLELKKNIYRLVLLQALVRSHACKKKEYHTTTCILSFIQASYIRKKFQKELQELKRKAFIQREEEVKEHINDTSHYTATITSTIETTNQQVVSTCTTINNNNMMMMMDISSTTTSTASTTTTPIMEIHDRTDGDDGLDTTTTSNGSSDQILPSIPDMNVDSIQESTKSLLTPPIFEETTSDHVNTLHNDHNNNNTMTSTTTTTSSSLIMIEKSQSESFINDNHTTDSMKGTITTMAIPHNHDDDVDTISPPSSTDDTIQENDTPSTDLQPTTLISTHNGQVEEIGKVDDDEEIGIVVEQQEEASQTCKDSTTSIEEKTKEEIAQEDTTRTSDENDLEKFSSMSSSTMLIDHNIVVTDTTTSTLSNESNDDTTIRTSLNVGIEENTNPFQENDTFQQLQQQHEEKKHEYEQCMDLKKLTEILKQQQQESQQNMMDTEHSLQSELTSTQEFSIIDTLQVKKLVIQVTPRTVVMDQTCTNLNEQQVVSTTKHHHSSNPIHLFIFLLSNRGSYRNVEIFKDKAVHNHGLTDIRLSCDPQTMRINESDDHAMSSSSETCLDSTNHHLLSFTVVFEELSTVYDKIVFGVCCENGSEVTRMLLLNPESSSSTSHIKSSSTTLSEYDLNVVFKEEKSEEENCLHQPFITRFKPFTSQETIEKHSKYVFFTIGAFLREHHTQWKFQPLSIHHGQAELKVHNIHDMLNI